MDACQKRPGQLHVVAEFTGPPNRLLSQGQCSVQLAAAPARRGEQFAGDCEQPVVVQFGGELVHLLCQAKAYSCVTGADQYRRGEQRFGEDRGIRGGFGPP